MSAGGRVKKQIYPLFVYCVFFVLFTFAEIVFQFDGHFMFRVQSIFGILNINVFVTCLNGINVLISSANQSTNQSINQSVSQSINQSVHLSVTKSVIQSIVYFNMVT